MFRKKVFTSSALAVALALATAGCGSDSPGDNGTSPGAPRTGGTLTLGLIAAATTFQAADMSFANESPFGQAVYDTLLKADPDGKVVPNLATEWKYNDAKTQLDLTLRNDVKFSDGTAFNAAAAAENLKRFQAGTSPNKAFLANITDAKAVDDTHLQITLKQADPSLLVSLTQNAGYQAAPSSFSKPDAKTNPVGSGPYTLDTGATVVGSSYVFNKNPNYWNKADQHYDKLVLKVLTDPTAMLNAAKGKQLNGVKLINNDTIDQLKASGFSMVEWEQDLLGVLIFDRDGKLNPALKDVRVRQAINYAFDKQGLLQAVGKGYGTPTAQIFPPRSPAYDASLDAKYAYDPAKAKQLLAEAGYPNGFTLQMPRLTALGAVFALIEQQLKDVGITPNFVDTAATSYLSDILAAKYSAARLTLQQDPTDWQVINFWLAPNATFNPFKHADPKVTELITKYQAAATEAEANAASKEINAYIVDQAWYAPWYRVRSNYAVDANTEVKAQVGNAHPYLWNFKPKG
jgi:peptide/nickel transport system substrate-binding protein